MYFIRTIIILNFLIPFSKGECNTLAREFELHLGTKTPYRIVAKEDTTKPNFPGCKPEKIWMMIRHGTRNPSLSFITQMKERLVEIRDLILENNKDSNGHLRHSDLDNLNNWKTKLQDADQKKLTHEGEEEMVALAERMQLRFPQLFSSIYSNTSYFFKYTRSQRTKASARYFAAGLFGKRVVPDVWFPPALKADPILRFYKLCDKWKHNVKNNPEALDEKRRFEGSLHVSSSIRSMNKILNLKNNELTLEDVRLIYMTCAFETAWNRKRKSPWCSVLTNETLKVVEYIEDLKYYYRDGYGYEITYAQACTAFKDVIDYFEDDSEYPQVVAYFTHSGALLKLLAHLGLYKDKEPLAEKKFTTADHKWKVSQIDSFGTNLAFVLYKCKVQNKIVVFHQERIVNLPGCGDMCDIEVVKNTFNESINNCSFDEICEVDV